MRLCNPSPSPRAWPARGFVLAATVWALAGLALLAAHINGLVGRDLERAHLAKQWIQDELDRRSTEATLLYLLATNRNSHRGLMLEQEQSFAPYEGRPSSREVGLLTMDGAAYAGLGNMGFSLQDEAGLASVNAPRDPMLAAALRHAGLLADDIRRVLPKIRDYIDLDQGLTLGGAERQDYVQRGLPPPADFFMAGPLELRKVLGLGELISPAQWRVLRSLLTPRPLIGYNFNLMRPEILGSLLELDAPMVANLLAERERRSVHRLSQIFVLTGRRPNLDFGLVGMLPSPHLRISVWPAGGGLRRVTGIVLTPDGETPWRTEYRYSEQAVDDGASVFRQAATPLF